MIRLRNIFVGFSFLISFGSLAQSFSLKEAIDYAIIHHVQVKNSQIDLQNANYQIICNDDGVVIGTNAATWRLYEYNYNLTLFEERYNVLSFIGGYWGLMYAR